MSTWGNPTRKLTLICSGNTVLRNCFTFVSNIFVKLKKFKYVITWACINFHGQTLILFYPLCSRFDRKMPSAKTVFYKLSVGQTPGFDQTWSFRCFPATQIQSFLRKNCGHHYCEKEGPCIIKKTEWVVRSDHADQINSFVQRLHVLPKTMRHELKFPSTYSRCTVPLSDFNVI